MAKLNLDTNQNIEKIISSQKLRKALAHESLFWFFHIYLSHYVQFPTADFQREMFAIAEDENISRAIIVAFRGSAKSTIFTLAYPLWALLGKQQKKFTVIFSQTSNQAKMILKNIRREIETNELIRRDFGKLDTEADEWKSTSIVIPKYRARISAFSTGESIRGVRHLNYRPDLILCDDIEDLQSTKTKEMRDKTSRWFQGEVIPAGNEKTKILIAGNLLHMDSLIVRLKEDIEKGNFEGIFRAYPLINKQGQILWPGRFPDQKAIEKLKKKVGNEEAWCREYLLMIISNADRVIHPGWIKYYDQLPKNYEEYLEFIATGVDLAISKAETASKTATVSAGILSSENGDFKIYIFPNPINERLTFPEIIERLERLSTTLGKRQQTFLYIEEVGFQKAVIQQLNKEGFHAEGVKVLGRDKRARLALTSHLIQNGTILFPRDGAKELIQQLVNFGKEKHDDLADAFSILIIKLMETINQGEPQFYAADLNSGPGPQNSLSFNQ